MRGAIVWHRLAAAALAAAPDASVSSGPAALTHVLRSCGPVVGLRAPSGTPGLWFARSSAAVPSQEQPQVKDEQQGEIVEERDGEAAVAKTAVAEPALAEPAVAEPGVAEPRNDTRAKARTVDAYISADTWAKVGQMLSINPGAEVLARRPGAQHMRTRSHLLLAQLQVAMEGPSRKLLAAMHAVEEVIAVAAEAKQTTGAVPPALMLTPQVFIAYREVLVKWVALCRNEGYPINRWRVEELAQKRLCESLETQQELFGIPVERTHWRKLMQIAQVLQSPDLAQLTFKSMEAAGLLYQPRVKKAISQQDLEWLTPEGSVEAGDYEGGTGCDAALSLPDSRPEGAAQGEPVPGEQDMVLHTGLDMYGKVVEICGMAGDFTGAEWWLDKLHAHTDPPLCTARPKHWLLTRLHHRVQSMAIAKHHLPVVLRQMQHMSRHGVTWSPRNCADVLVLAATSGDYDLMLPYLGFLEEHAKQQGPGGPLDEGTVVHILVRMARTNKAAIAERVVALLENSLVQVSEENRVERPSIIVYKLLMECYCSWKRNDPGQPATMVKGVFNTLARMEAANPGCEGITSDPFGLLREAPEALSRLTSSTDAAFFEILDRRQAGLPVTTAMVNVVLASCAMGKPFGKKRRSDSNHPVARTFGTLLEFRDKHGLPLNTHSFNCLLHTAVQCRDKDVLVMAMGLMRDSGVPRNAATFEKAALCFMMRGELQEALSTLQDMMRLGLQPRVSHVEQMYQCAMALSDEEENAAELKQGAAQLLQEMDMDPKHLTPRGESAFRLLEAADLLR